MSVEDGAAAVKPPIFVFGIARRSGTNFLFDLLRMHPDAGACEPLWEDYLVHYADRLDGFVQDVAARWRRLDHVWHGTLPADSEDRLLAALGNGLLGFLRGFCDRPVMVTKTPSPRNLDLAFRLFPDARIVVLVRDGRAVVESSVRSRLDPKEGNSYPHYTRQWADGAAAILAAAAALRGVDERLRMVRYEDLVEHLDDTMATLLVHCGLDAGRYDLAAAHALPVRGSSTFGHSPSARVDWDPRPRTPDFNPLARWADWPPERHAMFDAIAGPYMSALGYERTGPGDGPAV